MQISLTFPKQYFPKITGNFKIQPIKLHEISFYCTHQSQSVFMFIRVPCFPSRHALQKPFLHRFFHSIPATGVFPFSSLCPSKKRRTRTIFYFRIGKLLFGEQEKLSGILDSSAWGGKVIELWSIDISSTVSFSVRSSCLARYENW